ncbi:MBL fold metallo-hydrolase [Emticicia sp. BO119]|uniref:MBL fold metallo-hydrolase n=1 Tax=Emticicia sp. BO119 TaxID=2757768 RepID=UPI0015F122B9|nr:MBL fold metallo-hydrolase [Emticicia sp. BO119]MBA4852136.1 MBL fold metallo-hydrolase [Emticicia sp. BO119]
MQIHVIDAGHFKLDGGAMFGVVPKTIWHKQIPADENNLCSWKMRCLLVNTGQQLILIDSGMGDKQDARWMGFYYRHGDGDLIESIKKAGYSPNEITDVLCTHLHFDHCGGSVKWNTTKDRLELTFPNARYWTHSAHWESAINPNPREKATFLKENILPMQETGALHFTDKAEKTFGDSIELLYANGHTENMIMPKIKQGEKTYLFIADTIPSHAHVPIPYVMGYDIRPLQTMSEKEYLLKQVADNNWTIIFDHDPVHDAAHIHLTEKGYRVADMFNL